MFLATGTTQKKIALPERLEISAEIIKSFGTAGPELTGYKWKIKKRKHL
jgi:hypothetical protein